MNIIFVLVLFLLIIFLMNLAIKNQENINAENKSQLEKMMNAQKCELYDFKDEYAKIERVQKGNNQLLHENKKLNSKVETLEEKNKELKKIIKTKLNIGEVITARHLEEIFNEFKEIGALNDFEIINNVYIDDQEYERQIDHIVICEYGLFVIDTKHWAGDIFYNITKQNINRGKNNYLTPFLFTDGKDYPVTAVVKMDRERVIDANIYDNPYKQVWSAVSLISNDVLKTKRFINGIVYFNYNAKGKGQFVDGTTNTDGVVAVTNKEELKKVIVERMKKTYDMNVILGEEEIKQYTSILNKYKFDDNKEYLLKIMR